MIEIVDKRKLKIGILLVIIGILMPLLVDVYSLDIYKTLEYSIQFNDTLYFIFSALLLVFLNSIRAYPHYIGAFFISESIKLKGDAIISRYSKSIIIAIIIPIVYLIVSFIYQSINYHFGFPAATIIILLVLIGSREYNQISEWKKVCLIIFFISAFQFLDVTPLLDFLPFGQGEISKEIKLVSSFLDIEFELNVISLFFFTLFILFGILLFLLIREENRLKIMDILKKENVILENETRIKDVENRVFQEMKSLVHDLKSPLTSAQALVSLVKESLNKKSMFKDEQYLQNVEYSIDSMSQMISEILNEDVRFVITTDELLNSTLANVSKYKMACVICSVNNVPEKFIKVNKITFVRALVNIFENSYKAISNNKNGYIEVIIDSIELNEENFVEISIMDNGEGIDIKDLDKIWKSGFSLYNSHGLGLSFVKRTVEKSEGEIFFYSKRGTGTTVTILLREEEEYGNKH